MTLSPRSWQSKLGLTYGALMSLLIVNNAASWHIAANSAPEHPSVCMAHYGQSVTEGVQRKSDHFRNFIQVDIWIDCHF